MDRRLGLSLGLAVVAVACHGSEPGSADVCGGPAPVGIGDSSNLKPPNQPTANGVVSTSLLDGTSAQLVAPNVASGDYYFTLDLTEEPGTLPADVLHAFSAVYQVRMQDMNASGGQVTVPVAAPFAGACPAAVFMRNTGDNSAWQRVTDPSSSSPLRAPVALSSSFIATADVEFVAGTCVAECPGGACPDLGWDEANCGACGTACARGSFCVAQLVGVPSWTVLDGRERAFRR